MVLEIARADFALKWLFLTFPIPKPMLKLKDFRSMTPLKVGVPKDKLGFGGQKKVFRGPKKWKKTVFLNNPPTKKVVAHLPMFLLVFVSPLHWLLVWNILFFLKVVQEGCVSGWTGPTFKLLFGWHTMLLNAGLLLVHWLSQYKGT